jgi:hypothetical protein
MNCLSSTECPAGGVIQTAEPFVPEPSICGVEVTGKLKRSELPGADLIQEGGETVHSEIHLLSRSGTKKNFLTSGRNQLYLFTKRLIKLSVVIFRAYHCCQRHTKFYPTFFSPD